MSYYKYAERDADSQINWAEVGKGISDVLAETNRVRQEKKDAIDAATREFENALSNAPQGQNQDINNFTNKYAHNMMNQMRIDEQLLKSGQMPLDKYTLRRQNYVDGTNQLFDLSKLYQEEFKKKMEGVNSGELQALNVFNMGMVEGYADFNNSEAVIDSMGDGRVNIGLYETKIVDGKTVKVLSKNIAPVNVIRGKILQNVPTFKVEEATTATVKGFGSRKDVLYKAATISGAGSITELMGPDFLATKKDPTTQKIVDDMNQAIDDQISSYFSNPYNLTSVLTQNTGKYGSDSFTFDKEEAAKDASKILVKVDPNTNMTTIDTDGPNYKAQYDEAKDWVRTNILSKIDQERNIKTTGQLSRNDEPEWKNRAAKENKEAADAASMIGKLWYGDNNEVMSAIDYFKGKTDKDGNTIFKDFERDATGVTVVFANGESERINFTDANGNPRTQEDFIRSAGPLLAGQLDINTALKKGAYKKGAQFNKESEGRATTSTGNQRYKEYLEDNLDFSIIGKTEEEAEPLLKKYADEFGLVIEQTGVGDYILVKVPGEKAGTFLEQREFSFDESDPAKQKEIFDALIGYMSANAINTEKIPVKKGASSNKGTGGTIKGGNTR